MSDWDPVLDAAALVAFVPTTDLEAAAAFYGDTLGLSVQEVTPYACVVRSANVTLRATLVRELAAQPFTVLGWEVDDLDTAVTARAARGARPLAIPVLVAAKPPFRPAIEAGTVVHEQQAPG